MSDVSKFSMFWRLTELFQVNLIKIIDTRSVEPRDVRTSYATWEGSGAWLLNVIFARDLRCQREVRSDSDFRQ